MYSTSPDDINNLLMIESTRTFDLRIVKTNSVYGDRAFSAAAGRLWNPLHRYLKIEPCVEKFKKLLKTHLFNNIGIN